MRTLATKRWLGMAGPSAVFLTLLLPALARANIGPRWWGDLVGEATGVKGVEITREQLTIDLRPLASGELVRVEAIYHLRNPAAGKRLDLLFISGTEGVRDFEVRLGDQVLESKQVPREEWESRRKEMPASWKAPTKFPGIEWKETYARVRDWEAIPLAFSVELPTGCSELTARYRARASGTDEGHTMVTWQFPYILAPAREWSSFDRLELTVYLPGGWQSASDPALEREGEVLRGQFTGLPADTINLAVRAPVPPGLRRTVYFYLGLYGIVVVCGGVLCWLAGRLQGRYLAGQAARGQRVWGGRGPWIVASAVLMAVLWPALLYGAWSLGVKGIYAALAGQESPYFHELFPMPFLLHALLMLLAVPAGFAITRTSARCEKPEKGTA
jgi:hypothetical protein